jgi:hypothetical protein
LTQADPASSRAFVIKTKESKMNITHASNEKSHGAISGAFDPLALLDETSTINYWPARIAKIETALSDARESRRSARMHLLRPANPGGALASDESFYNAACEQVAQWEQALEEALSTIR